MRGEGVAERTITELLAPAAAAACDLLVCTHSAGTLRAAVRDHHHGRGRLRWLDDAAARGAVNGCVERPIRWFTVVGGVWSFAQRNGARVAECARVLNKIDPAFVHGSYGVG